MFANGLPQRSSSELQHRRCRERSLITTTEALLEWSVLQPQSQRRAYSSAENGNLKHGVRFIYPRGGTYGVREYFMQSGQENQYDESQQCTCHGKYRKADV